jgi:hypothetical protein
MCTRSIMDEVIATEVNCGRSRGTLRHMDVDHDYRQVVIE